MDSAIDVVTREEVQSEDVLPGFERKRRYRCEACGQRVFVRYVEPLLRPVFIHQDENQECREWYEEDEAAEEFLKATPRLRHHSSLKRPGPVLNFFNDEIRSALAVPPPPPNSPWKLTQGNEISEVEHSGLVHLNLFEPFSIESSVGDFEEPLVSHRDFQDAPAIVFRWHEMAYRALVAESRIETQEILYLLSPQENLFDWTPLSQNSDGLYIYVWITPRIFTSTDEKRIAALGMRPANLSVRLLLKALPAHFRYPLRLDFENPIAFQLYKPSNLSRLRIHLQRFDSRDDRKSATLEGSRFQDIGVFMKGLWADGNIIEVENSQAVLEVRDIKAPETKRYPKIDAIRVEKIMGLDAAASQKWLRRTRARLNRMSVAERPYWSFILAGLFTEATGENPFTSLRAIDDWKQNLQKLDWRTLPQIQAQEEETEEVESEETPKVLPKVPPKTKVRVSGLNLDEVETYYWVLPTHARTQYLDKLEISLARYSKRTQDPEKLEDIKAIEDWIEQSRLALDDED